MSPPETSDTLARENTPWLVEYADLFAGDMRVLDLGCGTGADSVELARIGCAVVSLDLDPDRVQLVPREAGGKRVAGDVVAGLPFRSASFDRVVASLSLHYFTSRDTECAVVGISRVLRPGGGLICRVNAVGDVNFGYGTGDEVEPSLFLQPDGRLKRFFDPPMLRRFLEPCFRLERILPRTILQGGVEKRTLECEAWKR